MAGWETGPTRFTPSFNQDAHAVPRKAWECELAHTAVQAGSDWMKCSSASPGQQSAQAAVRANASQVASAIAQPAGEGMWGCPTQPGVC